MTDVSVSDASDDTSALTVRPGLWPIWVGEGDAKTALWVVVGGFHIADTFCPDGFVTDLASIPAWLRWLLNPYAPDTAVPAAAHDWLLQCGYEERLAAAYFYVAMKDWGVPRWKRIAYFLGVILASSNW